MENNKWTYYKPMKIKNYIPNRMCASSKCGSLRKCLMPTNLLSMINNNNHQACNQCGHQVHDICLYQITSESKLCYECYVQGIEKYKDDEMMVSIVQTKYEILDKICQHEFQQKIFHNEVNIQECYKCNYRFHHDELIWKCTNDNDMSTRLIFSQKMTNWYCHMTICQSCYNNTYKKTVCSSFEA